MDRQEWISAVRRRFCDLGGRPSRSAGRRCQGIHATQIGIWKKKALEELAQVFTSRRSSAGLSVTLESSFCLEALDQAILLHGKPDIFDSDQGSQFTSTEFTDRLKAEGIRISMDGRGRAMDNIFVERLWRSVKYEEVYLHDYATVTEAIIGLKEYFLFYNAERQHQSLDYRTPKEVYEGQTSGDIKTLCAA